MSGMAVLVAREDLKVNVSSDGIVTVWNGNTTIAQGAATDGGGTGYDAAAVLWIIYCFLLGVPLVVGGVMLPRITTGIAIGLTVTVSSTSASRLRVHGLIDLSYQCGLRSLTPN